MGEVSIFDVFGIKTNFQQKLFKFFMDDFQMKSFKAILALLFTIFSSQNYFTNAQENFPSVMREMRAAWVATVANIDWPSKPGLSVDQQKQEAIAILKRIKELNMNTVVLQVRPQADALYVSDLEPWSYYLTGEQGKAPEPFYDPLEFWIEESHNRGIELHAWLNPYRANHSAMRGEISPKSIVKSHPDWVKKLGDRGYYWMDPSLQEVQDHSFAVVMDIVKRYDIDGIHFDDYFYPYRDYNDGKDFPDDDSYQVYLDNGGHMARDDWRRDAVNKFVQRVYEGIKSEKPYVKFGISPFGVYRPGIPPSIAGFDQYGILYADAKLWLNMGWIDYFTPQLYWPISRVELSYPVLLNWWKSENTLHRNLWPGLFIRPEIEKKEMALEIVNQIMVTRGIVPQSPGTMLFSMKSLMSKDSIMYKALSSGPFKTQALLPNYSWLDNEAPPAPIIFKIGATGDLIIRWKAADAEKPAWFVLYMKRNDVWTFEVLPGNLYSIPSNLDLKNVTAVAISAVDRCGNESEKSAFEVE
jgi:uncharacterized lipoprotein YddW (UPF0748 family)